MTKRILVCDDDPGIRRILSLLLRGEYEVSEACDGEEAVHSAAERVPDLVLLDISMPRMNGLSTLKALRRAHPSLRVLVLTGRTAIGIARRALKLGAAEFITKPFEGDLIRTEVRRALEGPGEGAEAAPERPWRVAP